MKNQKPRSDVFTGLFYQKFREEHTPTLIIPFQSITEEGKIPNSLYKSTITQISKLEKDDTKKENYKPVSLMKIGVKILKKNATKQNPTTNLKDHTS